MIDASEILVRICAATGEGALKEFIEGPALLRRGVWNYYDYVRSELTALLELQVFRNFTGISPLTAREVATSILEHLGHESPPIDAERSLAQLRRSLEYKCRATRRTRPYCVGIVSLCEREGADEWGRQFAWKMPFGAGAVELHPFIEGHQSHVIDDPGPFMVTMTVTGNFSHDSARNVRRVVGGRIRSLFRAISICETLGQTLHEPGDFYVRWADRRIPELYFCDVNRLLSLTRRAVQAWAVDPHNDKQLGIDRRIQTCLAMFLRAERELDFGLATMFYVSGVEALLVVKNEPIVDKVSNRVAVLLSHPNERSDATKFVKKIYEVRSRTVHGDGTKVEQESARSAKILAAGVLCAAIEYLNLLERLEDGESRRLKEKAARTSFHEELDTAYGKNAPIPGVDVVYGAFSRLWQRHV